MYAQPPAGYPPAYGGPPPATDPQRQQLFEWFQGADLNRTGSIDVNELGSVCPIHNRNRNFTPNRPCLVVNGRRYNTTRFAFYFVRAVQIKSDSYCLLDQFDLQQTGRLPFEAFVQLVKYLRDWNRLFLQFDRDRSGVVDGKELGEALRSFGFNLAPPTVAAIVKKFDKTGMSRITVSVKFIEFNNL